MTFLKSLAFGLLAFAAACSEKQAAEQTVVDAPPKPALWRVVDADTTVYFFGTVHVLPPEVKWQSPTVDKALEESKAVYFETDIDPDPEAFFAIIERLGMYDPSDSLSEHLSPEDLATLRTRAGQLGFPFVALQPMRPWYAAVVLSQFVITHAGYDASSGVERKLAPLARSQGKEIRQLESITEQMLAFADLPEAVQVRFLMDGLRDIDDVSPVLADMVKAWTAGDTSTLKSLLIDQDMGENRAIYDALLANRNAKWAPIIDALIRTEPGTFFIAVGGAHLIGDDSVFEKLRPLGYTAKRIE